MIPNSWFQLGIECQALFSPDSKCQIPFDDNFSNGHLWEISFEMLDFMWKMAQENRAFEIRNSLTNALYDAIWYVEITIWTTSYFKHVFALLWNMSWKNFLIFNHLIFVILPILSCTSVEKDFEDHLVASFGSLGSYWLGKQDANAFSTIKWTQVLRRIYWSDPSWYERLFKGSWLRKSKGRGSLISGSPDWGSNGVHFGVHHCDWYLRSYIEDIRRPISLGWKKSSLLWLVLIKMRFGSCMLSAFESRWFGWMSLLRVFSVKPWKIDSVGLFSCWTYLWVVWQWRMHTCGRLKLNEAVEFDDQGREDIRYLAHQIEEAIMCISMCIIVTSIYVVT